MILSWENNFLKPCYKKAYHLHSTVKYYDGHTIIQWIMLTSPQHFILKKTLANLVDIIKSIYKKKSVLLPRITTFHMVLCTTGPHLFSNTIRNIVNSNSSEFKGIRFDGFDYKDLGGIFKWDSGPEGPEYYVNILKNKHVKILRHYQNSYHFLYSMFH